MAFCGCAGWLAARLPTAHAGSLRAQTLDLTQSELLQLLNTKPSTIVELHCIIEAAGTRLLGEEQQELLTILASF